MNTLEQDGSASARSTADHPVPRRRSPDRETALDTPSVVRKDRRMPIFDGFTDDEVQRIKNAGTFVSLPADWSPIWEKTPSDKAYILLSGEVSVRKDGEEVARIGPGEIFGEMGIVNHKLRSASIVTTDKVEALHFTSEDLRQLCEEVPSFKKALDQSAQERLGS